MRKNKNEALIAQYRNNYILNPGIGKYKGQIEVSRVNPKGFYNIIGHIENESELNNFILNDLKENK